ncbi:hypothetical protein JYU34_017637 [Plutella xylostella]|uniref:Crossover junction endonuclease MUS81 n=1 Tax=Plutella xylostella TaxID=51655 RepID=A0ABQ7Q1L5_PLUXY|nr:hypothetical protein JYU34_017637 [Plutella xylostella]
MSEGTNTKRITFKQTKPNPLFQSWLQELYDESVEKNSKLKDMLKQALESLSRYPLPLQSGSDCAILQGFGKKLCLFLDKKLEVYNDNQAIDSNGPAIVPPSLSQQLNSSSEAELPIIVPESNNNQVVDKTNSVKHKQKSPKRPKAYKPSHRSGGYALLVALFYQYQENQSSPSLKREELILKAQPFSEESFTRPKPESYYTAWSNMTRLISKGLINKIGSRKAEFSLTTEGILLAQELLEDSKNIPSVNDIIFKDALPSTSTASSSSEMVVDTPQLSQVSEASSQSLVELEAGTFEVILLIDKMETSGLSNKNDPTVAQFKKFPDLKHEYRHLKVGDFTWVARSKANKDIELVLPFIVERKRMDDLGASIKDGRFHEQKFRLRKCGLKNVIYLVEHYGGNKHVGLPLPSLMQALANTRVHDGFKVHVTDSLTNSARFLAMMTKRLTIEYKDQDLIGTASETNENFLITFNHFNKTSAKSKTLTITDTFIKILLQLKGMSVEKALAITKTYSTPKELMETYKCCDKKEGEMLLTNLKHGQDRSAASRRRQSDKSATDHT